MSKAQRNLLVIMAIVILILGVEWLSHKKQCMGSTADNEQGQSNCANYGRDIEKLIGELLTVIPAGLLLYFALRYKKIEKKGKNE